ncbi:hypothetical protein GALMADRAFT_1351362, partial [Galerina marginata CBS 339.88]
MGDSYGHNAMLVLRSGIHSLYPTQNLTVHDEHRFTVVSSSETTYDIHDEDYEEQAITINKNLLKDPTFDLGLWYQARLPGIP